MISSILVVDDEPDLELLIVQKFRTQIRDGTMSFLFARDGVEALAVLAGNQDVDMVLSDINMPRMDGLLLLAKLQERDENLCTVIVSAYSDMVNIRTAMNRGAYDFVTKPIDFADLEATIVKTIHHVEAMREAQRRQAAAEQARASLSRYFSPNLAERLASSADALDLGGARREVASLFTDLTGFTTLVETIDPEVLGPLLNDYIVGMTDIVFAHDGTVAKIIGDALHVLFGAPADQPDHASRAVACSLALDAFARSFQEDWSRKGVALGATRIGAHAGTAVVGNFGGGRFFDYSAYGDTINVAARLQVANKALGTRICVSSSVAEKVPHFCGRPVGNLFLRGRVEPIRAFEPLEAEKCASAETQAYMDAFEELAAGDVRAVASFAALVVRNTEDRLASFHLKRLLNGESSTTINL
ncbi:adenylate/guanylate cyclase domain-containing response regulator [Rhizobium sp. SEMIA 4085]|uniref:Response regulator protein n=1 Tax=Rhizobium gallicum bv. gallicum R602sp TaxID=1041138 RepID=A0A0B4X6H8_9HYPH|nr:MULTISPECIES: adenylate/guanylate cyclase domain-containing protein [Rhizobium]AJD42335.1 response regulator protein [Rhizobium gallicum bv. gallicum R602sp]NNH32204.1 adenylate/guanylate cyclase domain-containing response regulator [Rhizobium sp. SEMIA 4085]